MRPTSQLTAVLLLATFGVVACSGNDQKRAKSVAPTAGTTAAATASESTVGKLSGGSGVAEKVAPKVTGSFAEGEAAYHAKKYDEAVAIFEGYTERRPGNAWGHYMLGLSAWKGGDRPKAEMAFEKALSIDPRHVKSLVNLSRVFLEQKRHDDAIERLTRAADIEPESGEVLRLLGRTYYAAGRKDEAEQTYRRAIELNELDAWSMNNLGLLFLETKRADEALPLLATAVELRKDVPEFQNNFGMALEHTGRFKAAATAYSGALAADPNYVRAKQNLARVEAVKAGPEEPFEVNQAKQEPAKRVDVPLGEKQASN